MINYKSSIFEDNYPVDKMRVSTRACLPGQPGIPIQPGKKYKNYKHYKNYKTWIIEII